MRPIPMTLAAFAALIAIGLPPVANGAPEARKVGFLGCMARPDDTYLAKQISESLEKRLLGDHLDGYEFLHDGVSRGRNRLSAGQITGERIAATGRVLGADKVILCLITFDRREPAAYTEGDRGSIELQAGFMIYDTATGALEKRETLTYHNDLDSESDAKTPEVEIRRKAIDTTLDNLERSLLAKLTPRRPSTTGGK